MTQQESHKHHYVPRFLLRPWAVDGVLSGYWWNARRSQLDCNQKGTKAFCFEIDHLTLKAHKDGRDAIEAEGLSGSPSALLAELGISLEDRALGNIQGLVDYPRIGGRLINSHWRLVRLGPREGTLVLSDRPLARLFGYEHPKASWFLPLGPKVMFYAARKPSDFERLIP